MFGTAKSVLKRAAALVVGGVMLGAAGVAQAGIIAYGYSGGDRATGTQVFTYGFRFTPVIDVFADSLGFFDEGLDGLRRPHRVGIWNAAGDLLVSATVSTANSVLAGPVINGGQFRYTSIPLLGLTAGQDYIVGGASEGAGDPYDFAGTNISTIPSVISIAPDGVFGFESFGFPTQTGNRYHSVSFTVPEPGTLALVALGLVGLGLARRRRRR